MRYYKIIAIVILVFMLASISSACAPLVGINDVKKDPYGSIEKASNKTIDMVGEMSYSPLKTGAEAVDGGKIEISTTNTSGQDLRFVLSQNIENKEYSTAVSNIGTGDGWKWMLDNGIAFLQLGKTDSDYYSIDVSDPAATIANSKIADLLNLSPTAAEYKLEGQYPAFLERYDAGVKMTGVNKKVITTLLDCIREEEASVEGATTLSGADAVQVTYVISSEKMSELVNNLNRIRIGNDLEYKTYVENLLRYVLLVSGCDFYNETEKTDGMDQRWEIAINDLKIYLLNSEADFTLSFAIDKKTGCLANISVFSTDEIKGESVTVQINADLLKLGDKEAEWKFEYQVSCKSRIMYDSHIIITNTIKNNSDSFRSHMIFEYRDKYEIWKDNYLIDYNKGYNDFSIYTSRDDQELGIFGNVTVMGQEMRMLINNVRYQDQEYDVNISIIANDNFETITPPVSKDLCKMSESELEAVQIKVIEYLPETIFGSWKSMEEFDIQKYLVFDPSYDYDCDGDCGDDDDKAEFEMLKEIYGQNVS